MKIVLTGVNGFVGRELYRFLINQGHEVTCMGRSRQRIEMAVGNVEHFFEWNSKTPIQDIAEILDGKEALINLAGAPVFQGRWTTKRKNLLVESRVNTTRQLVDSFQLCDTPPSTFLNTSAIGYYPHGQNNPMDESTERGDSFLSELAAEWESAALNAESSQTRVCLLRFGIILGSGGALAQMLLPFLGGTGGAMGNGNQWVSWMHLNDLMKAVSFCLENDSLQGPVNFTAPTSVHQKEIAKEIGNQLAKPSWLPAPRTALKAILGESANEILASQQVIPEKLIQAGFKFEFPEIQSALSDILQVSFQEEADTEFQIFSDGTRKITFEYIVPIVEEKSFFNHLSRFLPSFINLTLNDAGAFVMNFSWAPFMRFKGNSAVMEKLEERLCSVQLPFFRSLTIDFNWEEEGENYHMTESIQYKLRGVYFLLGKLGFQWLIDWIIWYHWKTLRAERSRVQ